MGEHDVTSERKQHEATVETGCKDKHPDEPTQAESKTHTLDMTLRYRLRYK